MKSYLSLVPISAGVHKRQNRMTLLCITIAVFLVTTIFSMADMAVRMEKSLIIKEYGNWHIMLHGVNESDAEYICADKSVAKATRYNAINYKINEDYYLGGKKATLVGADEAITDILAGFTEGSYPADETGAILSANAKTVLGIEKGDRITVSMPSGSMDFTVSGFYNDTAMAMKYDAIIVFLNMETFREVCGQENIADSANTELVYYIQLKDHANHRKIIADIKEQYGLTEENLGLNTALLGITGFSDNSIAMGFYLVAAILFVLILIAGVFMIAGSLNSNVAERTQFFGMLRCIGASRKQIIRLVRLEALNWCRNAIPTGIIFGIVITWILCAVLRLIVSSAFGELPVLGVSAVGIVCGAIVGILTVLIAAKAPAKRAARTSPMAAVTGNAVNTKSLRHGASIRFAKIETALGVYHAVSAKKNLILMTGSFALSIILFLSFSVMIDFSHQALKPLRPYTPDFSVMSVDRSCSVDSDLIRKIGGRPEVKNVFGRMYRNLPADFQDKDAGIDLISYDECQFAWAQKSLAKGDLSKVMQDDNYVLTVYSDGNSLTVGDKIQLEDAQLEVAGILEDSPFDSTGTPTVICSEKTFTRLTGETDYTVIDIQFTKEVTEEAVNELRALVGDAYALSDRRENNREVRNTYVAFSLFVYGFLAVIAMITVLNVINSISMSVSAKVKQYGAMRAVGMDGRQITRMVAAETVTYAAAGLCVGCAAGIPLYKFLYYHMITAYWGTPWKVPHAAVTVIVLLIVLAVVMAVYAPAKRIRNMSVADVINEL